MALYTLCIMSFVKEMTYCVINKFRMSREETVGQRVSDEQNIFAVNSTGEMFFNGYIEWEGKGYERTGTAARKNT